MKKIILALIALAASSCVDIDTIHRVESRSTELVDTVIVGITITIDSVTYELTP